MRILGIDPGIGITGWSILEPSGQRCTLVAAGTITTIPKTPTPERLVVLHRSLLEIITTYTPDEMAIEKLFFSRNVSTAMSVSEARGVLVLAAAGQNLPVHEYTPPQVKLAVVGYGKATKRQIMLMLHHHLVGAQVPSQDDAADAVAIALTHAATRPAPVAGFGQPVPAIGTV